MDGAGVDHWGCLHKLNRVRWKRADKPMDGNDRVGRAGRDSAREREREREKERERMGKMESYRERENERGRER